MNYVLTILSSGRPDYLERTLRGFRENVSPRPAEVYVVDDGGKLPPDFLFPDAAFQAPTHVLKTSGVGMCMAHAICWGAARQSQHEWAFHLEDDMRVLCPIDLRDLAAAMDENERLAQMTLMRTPWGAEIEHGGYIQAAPSFYKYVLRDAYTDVGWFETERNWACSPTLFRTDLARRFLWPTDPGCETEIGKRMLDSDPSLRFGIWGAGECHVAHLGVKRAPGSHGY